MLRSVIKRGVVAGMALVLLEAAYAVLRPTPGLAEFDPSGQFGDSTNPTLRVAVLGDSSVTAPGVAGPAEIWTSRVADRIAQTGRYVILRSFAVGGSMAHNLVRDQLGPTLAFEPDVVLVSVGANDAIKGVSKRRFARSLEHLIGELTTTGAVVVQSGVGDLGTIPRLYPPLRNLITRRSAAFDQVHKAVAARHGTHVVEQRADGRDRWLKDRGLWAADLFHVSGRGHEIWADLVWSTLEPRIPRFDGSR